MQSWILIPAGIFLIGNIFLLKVNFICNFVILFGVENQVWFFCLLFQKHSSFWRLCFTLVVINHARLLASYSADALGISPVSAAYVSLPLWTPPAEGTGGAEVWRFQSLLIALPLASHVVLFGMRFLLLNRIIPASSFLPCSFSTHKWFSEISNCISLAMSFS